MQRHHGKRAQFLQQKLHHQAVAAAFVIVQRHAHGGRYQFAQQRRHSDDTTVAQLIRNGISANIDRAHLHIAAGLHGVLDVARNPDRALRRHHPGAEIGGHQDSAHIGVDQLATRVGMRGDIEAVLQLARHPAHSPVYRLVVIPVFALSKHGVFAIVVVIQGRAQPHADTYLWPDAKCVATIKWNRGIGPTVWSQK
ncbi:hypothetical protein D3C72_1599350 [compost metagenome]